MKLDNRFQHLPLAIQAYSRQVVEILQSSLHENIVGVYILGSAALGGFILGRSDIDIQGVCARPLTQQKKEEVVALLAHPALPCPTRGCEFVLYSQAAVNRPSLSAGFELNLNSGPQMPYHVTYSHKEESAHWFILDREIAREHGISIFGPEPQALFAALPRAWALEAMLMSARWHKDHDVHGYSSILNACRAWQFAEENRWTSKAAAIEWASTRVSDCELLQQALALRAGTTDKSLDQTRAEQLLTLIEARIKYLYQRELQA